MWQDLVLMIGSFMFAPPLIISAIKRVKYPLYTSLTTAIVLTSFVACYITLGLTLAAISTGIVAACWYLLAIRKGT